MSIEQKIEIAKAAIPALINDGVSYSVVALRAMEIAEEVIRLASGSRGLTKCEEGVLASITSGDDGGRIVALSSSDVVALKTLKERMMKR